MKSLIENVLNDKPMIREIKEDPEKPVMNQSPEDEELLNLVKQMKIQIKIIGCGGGGSNTINRLMEVGIYGAELIAANTDAKHLLEIKARKKILIGKRKTKGLGAGSRPEVGEEAAREADEELRKVIQNSNIVFVTAGMGGGTGTGAAPYVAKAAKETGALVISIVTLPFKAEGKLRMENAMWGLEKLKRHSDTTIVIPNDKLLALVPRLPLDQAFKVADEILMQAIKGLTEIITKPGLVNLDYSDIRTIMENGGVAMVGIGESDSSQDRVTEAVEKAIQSPLIEADISNAKGALIRVVGDSNMSVMEAQKTAEIIQRNINPNASIIWGACIDPTIQDSIRVLIILTGVKSPYILSDETSMSGMKKMVGLDMGSADIDIIE